MTAVVWFRQDLRLSDNPALSHAIQSGDNIIPLYIHAPEDAEPWEPGGASRSWLHYSLAALEGDCERLGSRLIIRRGPVSAALLDICREVSASTVYWNRLYEPALSARDSGIEAFMRQRGISVKTFNAALLYEPREVTKTTGEPYRVFTPFWKAIRKKGVLKQIHPRPTALPSVGKDLKSLSLAALELLPKIPWDRGFYDVWTPGEAGAQHALSQFLSERVEHYRTGRDHPGSDLTSRLSPHLHFGEISPRQVAMAIEECRTRRDVPNMEDNTEAFVRELAWREFAYHLLVHFPYTAEEPLNPRFAEFPWASDPKPLLAAWQRGLTGYPMVDAGMRELWATGWMHNRVRMLTASFLTKNLRVWWLEGAKWFWDTLVDADLASNSFGWQWTAGCGADAAPYFRVFNPVLQGERFDPEGRYVRRWIPELSRLPAAFVHQPWRVPENLLADFGVKLGENYPRPIVDLSESRKAALAAYQSIR